MCFVCLSVTLDPSKICKAARVEADQKRGEAERIPGRLAEEEKKVGAGSERARGRKGRERLHEFADGAHLWCMPLRVGFTAPPLKKSERCALTEAARCQAARHTQPCWAERRKQFPFHSGSPLWQPTLAAVHCAFFTVRRVSMIFGGSAGTNEAAGRRRAQLELACRAADAPTDNGLQASRNAFRSAEKIEPKRKSDGTARAALACSLASLLHRRGFGWLHLQISAAETTHGV